MMNEFAIEDFRISEKDKAACWDRKDEEKAIKVPRRTGKQLFLATMPISDSLATAKGLGANPLILLLLINTAHKMSPASEWVKIPPKMLSPFDLPRQRITEAAKSLEHAGVIAVDRKPGHKNRYRLVKQ